MQFSVYLEYWFNMKVFRQYPKNFDPILSCQQKGPKTRKDFWMWHIFTEIIPNTTVTIPVCRAGHREEEDLQQQHTLCPRRRKMCPWVTSQSIRHLQWNTVFGTHHLPCVCSLDCGKGICWGTCGRTKPGRSQTVFLLWFFSALKSYFNLCVPSFSLLYHQLKQVLWRWPAHLTL